MFMNTLLFLTVSEYHEGYCQMHCAHTQMTDLYSLLRHAQIQNVVLVH